MNRKVWSFVLSAALISTVIAGCSGAQPAQNQPAQNQPAPAPTQETKQTEPKQTKYPITLKDAAGREVTIAAEPKRIVSNAPSNTELVFALGKGSALVGRSDFDDYPEEAKKVESIGGWFPQPNYEKIVSLKPDLMLVIAGTPEARDKLANDYKIPVFVLDPKNFDELYDGIKTLGQILNAQDAAEKMVADMQAATKEIADKAAKATSKPKVFYEVWDDPLMTAGSKTFIDDMIRIAGGINAGGDVEGWSNYSLEQLQANNPDIIMTGKDAAAKIHERKGWEGLKAIKENSVVIVAEPDTVTRPGPRLIQGLKWFAKVIHPDLFN